MKNAAPSNSGAALRSMVQVQRPARIRDYYGSIRLILAPLTEAPASKPTLVST
jgi:hypothetical protein